MTNLASMFAPMGQVVVGLGVLALPPLWVGGSRWSLALAILIGGSYVHAVHVLGFRGANMAVSPDAGFALVFWAASSVWAVAMLVRSRLPQVSLLVLASFSAMVAGMIWTGKFGFDFDPAVGPGLDLPIEMAALAWFGIGLSVASGAERRAPGRPGPKRHGARRGPFRDTDGVGIAQGLTSPGPVAGPRSGRSTLQEPRAHAIGRRNSSDEGTFFHSIGHHR